MFVHRRRSCRFIKTADECRRLNNFNSMFAIVAGLNSAPCFRLHKTKALVSSEKMAICDELNELASSAKSYKKYREVLHTRNPPCVPFTGDRHFFIIMLSILYILFFVCFFDV